MDIGGQGKDSVRYRTEGNVREEGVKGNGVRVKHCSEGWKEGSVS